MRYGEMAWLRLRTSCSTGNQSSRLSLFFSSCVTRRMKKRTPRSIGYLPLFTHLLTSPGYKRGQLFAQLTLAGALGYYLPTSDLSRAPPTNLGWGIDNLSYSIHLSHDHHSTNHLSLYATTTYISTTAMVFSAYILCKILLLISNKRFSFFAFNSLVEALVSGGDFFFLFFFFSSGILH